MLRLSKIKIISFISILFLGGLYWNGMIPLTKSQGTTTPEVLGSTDLGPLPPFWTFETYTPSAASPEISGEGAIAINLTTNQIFFSKNPDMRLHIASTVKIMTALLAIENKPLDYLVTISPKAGGMEPDSMGIYRGERLTLKQLLLGLILVSGNDAAEAIAEGVASTRESFVALMNTKAHQLGMNNTHYINPSGLEGDGDHYSSAMDLALLSKYALTNDTFRDIVGRKQAYIPLVYTNEENHKSYTLNNSSPLVNYPGYLGIKPGFTPEAKKCLVTLVEQNGQEILVVILGSDDRKGDTEKLLEYSGAVFKH